MASGDTLFIFTPYSNEPPASSAASMDTRNSEPCLDFDGNVDEEGGMSGVVPRNYANGGFTVDLHVRFSSATSGSAFYQVAFENKEGLDIDSDSFASFKGVQIIPNGTNGVESIGTITFADGSEIDNLGPGDAFRIKIRRDADGSAGTDDITTDAELYEIEGRET